MLLTPTFRNAGCTRSRNDVHAHARLLIALRRLDGFRLCKFQCVPQARACPMCISRTFAFAKESRHALTALGANAPWARHSGEKTAEQTFEDHAFYAADVSTAAQQKDHRLFCCPVRLYKEVHAWRRFVHYEPILCMWTKDTLHLFNVLLPCIRG